MPKLSRETDVEDEKVVVSKNKKQKVIEEKLKKIEEEEEDEEENEKEEDPLADMCVVGNMRCEADIIEKKTKIIDYKIINYIKGEKTDKVVLLCLHNIPAFQRGIYYVCGNTNSTKKNNAICGFKTRVAFMKHTIQHHYYNPDPEKMEPVKLNLCQECAQIELRIQYWKNYVGDYGSPIASCMCKEGKIVSRLSDLDLIGFRGPYFNKAIELFANAPDKKSNKKGKNEELVEYTLDF